MATTRRRTPPRAGGSRPRTRRPARSTRAAPAAPRLTPGQRRELSGIGTLALGVIGVILLGFPQAPFAHAFARAVSAGVGIGGWIVGLALIGAGLAMLASRGPRRSLGTVLAALTVSCLAAIAMAAVSGAGYGGALGRAIGPRAATVVGAPATLVALAALGLAGLVVALDLAPSRISGAALLGASRLLGSLFASAAPAPVASLPTPAPTPLDLQLGVPESEGPAVDGPVLPPEPFQRIFEELEVEAEPASTPATAPLPVPPPVDLEDDPEGPEPNWVIPSLDLLDSAQGKRERLRDEIRSRIKTIEATLANFGVDSKVMGVNAGPTVTQYELQPGSGVPVRRVLAYQTDLSLALAAPIRIQAPIPGKSAIGIEVPNKAAQLVTLKEVVQAPSFHEMKSGLSVALGADVSGRPVLGDLAAMPHLLIAGATGSGKSVCINAVLAGLLLQSTPRDLRLILVDPKRVELSNFAGLPHLLVPVVVEPEGAVASLRWAVVEMEQRYKLFAGNGARNITVFNERAPQLGLRPLPKIVIVIDELADLMMVAASEIEDLICRIAQLARAVGIHLIVATQRPSADIITGLIKANIPSRVAFAVSSGVDSRVILDEMGAEKLLGRGDMLYLPIDAGKATRLQGAYVSDRELDQLIGWWKAQGTPAYQEEILQAAALGPVPADGAQRRDPLFERAGRIVIGEGRAATSLLQRRLQVGYTRAARLVDQLAEARVVGPYEGSKSREVLMTLAELEQLLDSGEGDE